MMRLGIATLAVALWVGFLAVFVPASLYSGTVIGVLVALIVLYISRRLGRTTK